MKVLDGSFDQAVDEWLWRAEQREALVDRLEASSAAASSSSSSAAAAMPAELGRTLLYALSLLRWATVWTHFAPALPPRARMSLRLVTTLTDALLDGDGGDGATDAAAVEAKLHMLTVALLHLSTLPQDEAKPKAAAAPGPLRVGRFAEHHPMYPEMDGLGADEMDEGE